MVVKNKIWFGGYKENKAVIVTRKFPLSYAFLMLSCRLVKVFTITMWPSLVFHCTY